MSIKHFFYGSGFSDGTPPRINSGRTSDKYVLSAWRDCCEWFTRIFGFGDRMCDGQKKECMVIIFFSQVILLTITPLPQFPVPSSRCIETRFPSTYIVPPIARVLHIVRTSKHGFTFFFFGASINISKINNIYIYNCIIYFINKYINIILHNT